jgi:hypothetical protein
MFPFYFFFSIRVPLHDVKVAMWYAINTKQINGPILYAEIINSDGYV